MTQQCKQKCEGIQEIKDHFHVSGAIGHMTRTIYLKYKPEKDVDTEALQLKLPYLRLLSLYIIITESFKYVNFSVISTSWEV